MKDQVPDIYKALGLFIIVLAVWWFKPVPMIDTMLGTVFGAVIGFLTGRRANAEQTEGSK